MALSSLAQSLVRESYRTWNGGNRQPTVVSYSFADSDQGWSTTYAEGHLPFSAPQMASVRMALDAWASVSGLSFVEVPDQPVRDAVDIRIRLADFTWDDYEATSPYGGGDVTIDDKFATDTMAPGTEGYEVLLLTLGYALGLNTLDTSMSAQTAMAIYAKNSPNVAGLRAADVEAIQYVYGTQQAQDGFHTRWSWDSSYAAIRHEGNDSGQTMTGTAMRDVIFGHGGDDVVNAGAGNDVIYGGTGLNTISGGDGIDTLATGLLRHQTVLVKLTKGYDLTGSVSGTLYTPGEHQVFKQIESLAFGDGRLVFDANDPVAQVNRLYQAALGRLPDSVGREHWTAQIMEGTPLSKLAEAFLGSAEFQARFGQPDDANFIVTAYRQALGREPDAEGAAFWQAKLAGGMSRAELLAGFSESAENRTLTMSSLDKGLWDGDDQMAEIARLYKAVLGRVPEIDGLRFWHSQMALGMDIKQIANDFAQSAEFTNRFPGGSDAEFVNAVYQNALGRGIDATGQAFWLDQLAHGMTRGEMVGGVSHSTEFLVLSAELTEGGIVFA